MGLDLVASQGRGELAVLTLSPSLKDVLLDAGPPEKVLDVADYLLAAARPGHRQAAGERQVLVGCLCAARG